MNTLGGSRGVKHVQNGGIVHRVVVNGEIGIEIMSRLIIRNLPKNIKEERIRSIFAAKGELTDVKLCHTKDGKFRRFGFIGYKTEDQAKAALQHFNSSFIDTSKITVDFAKSLGDESLPRPWSRYSEGSSANDRLKKKKERKAEELKDRVVSKPTEAKDPSDTHSLNKKKSGVVNEKSNKERTKALDDLEQDTEFQEFLSVHKHRGSKQTWSNDNVEHGQSKPKGSQIWQRKEKTVTANKSSKIQLKYDDSDDSGNEDEVYDASGVTEEWTEDAKNNEEDDDEETRIAKDSKLSDMDYLKSKVVSSVHKTVKTKKSKRSQNNKIDDSENEEETNRESLDDEPMDVSLRESDQDTSDSYDNDDDVEEGCDDEDNADGHYDDDNNSDDSPKKSSAFGTIKMRGLPFKAKEQHIEDFFAPLRIVDIRIIKNAKGKPTGCAFVDFGNEKDIKEALKRDRDCIEGRYIELFRDKGEQSINQEIDKEKPWMKKLGAQGGEEEFESIAESGRLFLRNLAYACSEEDLQNLFEKFGPLTETYLPLDKTTNKPTGIGFVTFVMPEHAVKAFNELDGKIFQGRLLHILPSKAKETKDEDTGTVTSFKSKRDAKKKSLSSHDHNWNTLFLGVNAVAEVMAEQYNTTKGSILDDASSRSLAVRMALGETQVVTETRKFLVSEGVKLDVFGQPSGKRSKTVILVKNLPFNTPCEELRNIFAPFGNIVRLVLPPSGITALVEFFEPSQAKKAFQKLAYSKFKHVPLYLEWAPLGVFSGKPEEKLAGETSQTTKQIKDKETPRDKESDTQDDEGGDSENTEGTSVFIKNLNFDTTEDSLKEAFSKLGPLLSATIAKKKDPKKPGHLLSMGYGFVEYKKRSDALKAIKELQCEYVCRPGNLQLEKRLPSYQVEMQRNSTLEGHTLELKMSHRKTSDMVAQRKTASAKKQNSSKILVRNVPFEASKKELKELFGTFGEIKTLRLPQKLSGSGTHRGFAFVDFLTKQDAKRAFESLCSSTHLYGRRLVLEWAEDEDSVDALRKRTAEHFHGSPKTAKKKKDILDDLLDAEMPE